MRIKRMATLLLAFCLVFALVAPSVAAVTVDSSVNHPGQNGNVGSNSLQASGNGTLTNGLDTLRGQEASGNKKPGANTNGGQWTATPSDKDVGRAVRRTVRHAEGTA